jgi:molybdenum cofactor cytidylyltransferase
MTLGVVILAAGASARMGRPKLLLPWGGTSVIGHLIRQWRRLGAVQIGVVHAAGDPAMLEELDRLEFSAQDRIVNPHPAQGMFSSVQCAACWPGWRADLGQWVVTLGDQPHLREGTLRALLEFGAARRGEICQPAWRGRAQHPVLLPAAAFRQLADWPGGNLRQFLQTQSVALCDAGDAGLEFDIDEPADYERALALWLKEHGPNTESVQPLDPGGDGP